jgi:hypothetical protein
VDLEERLAFSVHLTCISQSKCATRATAGKYGNVAIYSLNKMEWESGD